MIAAIVATLALSQVYHGTGTVTEFRDPTGWCLRRDLVSVGDTLELVASAPGSARTTIGDGIDSFTPAYETEGYGLGFGVSRDLVLLGNWPFEGSERELIYVGFDGIHSDPQLPEYADCELRFTASPLEVWTMGDSTLDGSFNTADLVAVFAAGEYEDTARRNSTWASGDWNIDGEFDTRDLIVAMQAGTYERPAAAVPVPEPAAWILALPLICLASRRGR